jgi:hypothetical protein
METLSRTRSLEGYTIDTRGSSFRKRQASGLSPSDRYKALSGEALGCAAGGPTGPAGSGRTAPRARLNPARLPVRRPLQGVRDIPPATAAARPNGQKRYLRARERAPAEQFPVGSKNWSEVEYAAPAREFPALEKMPCNASKNSPFPCVGNFASSRTRLAAAIQSQCDENNRAAQVPGPHVWRWIALQWVRCCLLFGKRPGIAPN